MTRAFKFYSIVFLIAMATLGLAYYYDHVTRKESITFNQEQAYGASNPAASVANNAELRLGKPSGQPLGDAPLNMTNMSLVITNTFDVRGTNEVRMMGLMTEALATLGIEKDENTVRRLVLARIKADWSTTPESFRTAPDWAALQARTLKFKISQLLDTTNQLTIQRVLECPIGPEVPPMADYEVRTGDDAVWQEAEAMKK